MNRDRVRRTLCTEKTPEENRTSQRNSTKLRSPRAPRSRIATSKHGDVPTVNALVDIGNLVSIRHALPVAVFDLANVAAPVTVSFAAGDEPFTDLGSTEAVHPDPGEVVFIDGNGEVCARRWCWRQSAGSVTGPDTSDALVVVEGHHETAGQDVESALSDLASLLASHQPQGRTESWVLSPENPRAGTGEGVEDASG